MADTRIYRTQTAGNTTTWTFSAWIKRCGITGVAQQIFNANTGSSNPENTCYFDTAEKLNWYNYIGGVTLGHLQTTRVFRDVGAWMHIVCVWDTENATAGDRMKIWINGVRETVLTIDANPAEDQVGQVNTSGSVMNIGANGYNTNYDFDGCMSHVQFVDGLALAPTEFGEVDSTSGIWKIKTACYGTPGNNGFCLKMEDSSNMDLDSSSNALSFTTAGTLTATYDNPSNNFCTMNPLANYYAGGTFSEGNNKYVSGGGGSSSYIISTMGLTAGKWYCEVKPKTSAAMTVGIVDKEQPDSSETIAQTNYGSEYQSDGEAVTDGGSTVSYGDSYTTDDIIGIYLDLDNNKLYFGKNGTVQASGTGRTITGISAMTSPQGGSQGCYFIAGCKANGGSTWEFNFGNGYFGTTAIGSPEEDAGGIGAFKYDPSSGTFDGSSKDFRAICTKNIKAYGG